MWNYDFYKFHLWYCSSRLIKISKISPSLSFFFFLFPAKRSWWLVASCVKSIPVAADWPWRENGGHSRGHPGRVRELRLGDQLPPDVQWRREELEAVSPRGEHPGKCVYWKAVCQCMNCTSYNILLPICQVKSLLNYSKICPRNVRHMWHFRIHCLCIIYEISKR